MRVTKTIREYIEESAKTTIIETTPMPATEEFAKMHETVRRFVDDLDEAVEAYVKKHIADFRAECGIPDDVTLEPSSYSPIRWSTYNSAMDIAAKAEKRARDKRIEEAVKDIVLDLELGGTRADLENKLKALR